MRVVPACAALALAFGLYASRGVLDQVVTASGLVRVALLPPWPVLGGFFAIGLLALLWLDRRALPRGQSTAVRPPIAPMVLPAFAALLLVVPYLPVLPDRWPALQMLAGPLRGIVWLALAGQFVWVLWQARMIRADWLQRWTLGRLTLAIAALTVIVSGAAASKLTRTALFPAGDEPHYLVMAQSLWRDGDLKIENNHARGDYREYFPLPLDPHYLTRGADGEIYSIHPVGLPVLLAPIYALGGYGLVVWAIVLLSALACAWMWRWVVLAGGSAGAATFAWAAVALTTPFLYNSFAVYPEIAAAVAVVLAYTGVTAIAARPQSPLWSWLLVGLGGAVLPWLSTKYAPMSAALIAIALVRAWWPPSAPVAVRVQRALAVAAPYALSLAGWFSFFYWIWGIPLPQAPYGALVQTSPFNLVFGAPGLLFDQEYGLLPYAPVYILALTGLWAMVREGGEMRRRSVEIVLLFAALLGTVGAFRIWWGGSASPGRPITSGLLLLALPMAMAFRTAPAGSARRAAHMLLLWISVGIATLLLIAQNGFLTANGRDGTSSLLEFLSPRWPAWSLAPSFIFHEAGPAWMYSIVWLMLAAAAAWALGRVRTARPGVASLAALSVGTAGLLAAALIMPLLPTSPAWPAIAVEARPRLPLLDEFDATARPLAIAYDPLRPIDTHATLANAVLSVAPGTRLDPQPVRVLHNGRFTLPAGRYRIEVEWSGARTGERLGLQLGRVGDPWRTWDVNPQPGERWSTEFEIPMDASFVGLRGTPELERTVGRITVVPLSIVDAGQRPRLPVMIAASQSGPATIFYYDLHAFPEEAGFWVRGGRSTRVSIARDHTDGPVVLRVHSGVIANRLHLSTFGWAQSVSLQPRLRDDVEIPAEGRRLVTIDLATDEAFVAKQFDPASRDERPLGVWVEVVR